MMVNIQAAIIIIGVVAGVAVGGALFLLYPDMMFKGTSMSGQSEFSPDGTTTAGSPSVGSPDAGGGIYGGMP